MTFYAIPIWTISVTDLNPLVTFSLFLFACSKYSTRICLSLSKIASVRTYLDWEIAIWSPSEEPCAISTTLIIFIFIWADRFSLLTKSCLILAAPAITYPWMSSLKLWNILLAYSHAFLTKLNLLSSLSRANLTEDWPPLLWLRMISLLSSFKICRCPPFTLANKALFPSITMKPNAESLTRIYSLRWLKLKFLPHEYTYWVIGRCGSITSTTF